MKLYFKVTKSTRSRSFPIGHVTCRDRGILVYRVEIRKKYYSNNHV